jgi:hypothetical protein
VTIYVPSIITKIITKMKRLRRGRPPIGRKAMTAAERQAKRRQRIRREAEMARRGAQGHPPRPYQPPHGYPKAREHLSKEGHKFERCRREWGFEEGVFVDGAFVSSSEVIYLATLPLAERKHLLAETRRRNKDFTVSAVEGFMAAMQVSFEELCEHVKGSAFNG